MAPIFLNDLPPMLVIHTKPFPLCKMDADRNSSRPVDRELSKSSDKIIGVKHTRMEWFGLNYIQMALHGLC